MENKIRNKTLRVTFYKRKKHVYENGVLIPSYLVDSTLYQNDHPLYILISFDSRIFLSECIKNRFDGQNVFQEFTKSFNLY